MSWRHREQEREYFITQAGPLTDFAAFLLAGAGPPRPSALKSTLPAACAERADRFLNVSPPGMLFLPVLPSIRTCGSANYTTLEGGVLYNIVSYSVLGDSQTVSYRGSIMR